MKEGDLVGYVSVKGDSEFQHCGKIIDETTLRVGSGVEAMVKIEGKGGYVRRSHCRKITEAELEEWRKPPAFQDTIEIVIRRTSKRGSFEAMATISGEFLDDSVSAESFVMEKIKEKRAEIAREWALKFKTEAAR